MKDVNSSNFGKKFTWIASFNCVLFPKSLDGREWLMMPYLEGGRPGRRMRVSRDLALLQIRFGSEVVRLKPGETLRSCSVCAPIRYLFTWPYYTNFRFAPMRGVSTGPEGDAKLAGTPKGGLKGIRNDFWILKIMVEILSSWLAPLPQFSHSSIHDWYSRLASSKHIWSMPASSESVYWSSHDSISNRYWSWQSDLQPAIERRLNPKMVNTKTKTTMIHFFAMILAPSPKTVPSLHSLHIPVLFFMGFLSK